jgi:hypothetical protein
MIGFSNILKVKLKNPERYLDAIENVSNSLTGLIEIKDLYNQFIIEAAQQLKNSILFFESGYFDAAYYAMRNAIESAVTMVFINHYSNRGKEKYIKDWLELKNFPGLHKMTEQLIKDESTFADLKEKMPEFFARINNLRRTLNKIVHKQGMEQFYLVHYYNMIDESKLQKYISDFEHRLSLCIGAVAVIRLAIDPFPILLRDEDIFYRCFESMSDPYSDKLINDFIGSKLIQQYKNTSIYQDYYNAFINSDKRELPTDNVMRYQFVELKYVNIILKQAHLLSPKDIYATLLFSISYNFIKIYTDEGFTYYWCDRKTSKQDTGYESSKYKNLLKSNEQYNIENDNRYYAIFLLENKKFLAEYEKPISKEDYEFIRKNTIEKFNSIKSKAWPGLYNN